MPRRPAPRPKGPRRSPCPVASALDILGDTWTLVVVRDLLWFGKRRFADFAASGEGISTNILAERLERLECEGIVTRRKYQEHPARYEYVLTPKGRELFPDPLHIFQWHGEGFELPRGAVRLASTGWFPNQAMRIGSNAYGLQFHPEVTETVMRRWSQFAGHRLVLPGAQVRDQMRSLCAKYDAGIAAWLSGFLDRWLQPHSAALQDRGEEAVRTVAAG